jgi:MYXO-CTERM domain-containing protein
VRVLAPIKPLLLIGLCFAARAEAKPFMEYLKPTPITCSPLSSASWGVSGVLPRDLCNGIESAKGAGAPPDYYYWDGEIIRAKDGKYHLFMSTWAGSAGFNPGWTGSDAYHAVSSMGPLGPYQRQDYVYSNNGSHKGHNVSALELPDGSYAVVVSETVPFTIYKSSSLDGPWTGCQASIQSNGINYGSDGNFASNVARDDGKFEIVQRHGLIGIADTLCGPYRLQKPSYTYPAANRPSIDSIYPKRTSIPGVSNPTFAWEEDPHIWRSGGTYHVLYSGSGDRVGYHLHSPDGIHDWTDNGLAFTPRQYQNIFCYEGGNTCTQWYKMERPGVVIEDGHPTYVTWAVADVDKDNQIPAGSNHGSKVVVVPIDGLAFDADFGSSGGAAGGGSGAGGGSAGAAGDGGSGNKGGGGAGGSDAGRGGLGNGGASGGGSTDQAGKGGGSAIGGSPATSGSGGMPSSDAPSSGSGGTTGGSPTAQSPSDSTTNDSSGCACVVGSTSRNTPLAPGLLLGAVGIFMARRRRDRRRFILARDVPGPEQRAAPSVEIQLDSRCRCSPDKNAVFRELKAGGRLAISDVVALKDPHAA